MSNRLVGSFRLMYPAKSLRGRVRGVARDMRIEKRLEAERRNTNSPHVKRALHRRGECSCSQR